MINVLFLESDDEEINEKGGVKLVVEMSREVKEELRFVKYD